MFSFLDRLVEVCLWIHDATFNGFYWSINSSVMVNECKCKFKVILFEFIRFKVLIQPAMQGSVGAR